MLSFRAKKVLFFHVSILYHKIEVAGKMYSNNKFLGFYDIYRPWLFIFEDFSIQDNNVTIPLNNNDGCTAPEQIKFYLNVNYHHYKPFGMQLSVDTLR